MKTVLSILIILASSTSYSQQAATLLNEVSAKVRSYDKIKNKIK
jgi:predicted porin